MAYGSVGMVWTETLGGGINSERLIEKDKRSEAEKCGARFQELLKISQDEAFYYLMDLGCICYEQKMVYVRKFWPELAK